MKRRAQQLYGTWHFKSNNVAVGDRKTGALISCVRILIKVFIISIIKVMFQNEYEQ